MSLSHDQFKRVNSLIIVISLAYLLSIWYSYISEIIITQMILLYFYSDKFGITNIKLYYAMNAHFLTSNQSKARF